MSVPSRHQLGQTLVISHEKLKSAVYICI